MNRKWIVPVFAAAAAGVLAFGVTRHAACRAAGPGIDRLRDVSFLTRELSLNGAQVIELRRLHTALGLTLRNSCTRHCAARMRLGPAVAGETNEMMQAEAALAEMCLAYEQSERGTLAHIRAVRAVLDNEQRRRFEEMISECLCRPHIRQVCACMAEAGTVVP
jgi:hypothetical protein